MISESAAAAGVMAGRVAELLTARGYAIQVPPGRDPAVFRVVRLRGRPEVEVSVEGDGYTGLEYIAGHRAFGEAGPVVAAILGLPAHPDIDVDKWDGRHAVDWHYLPPKGQPVGPEVIADLLSGVLAVIAGR
jgi:hypothetical protein